MHQLCNTHEVIVCSKIRDISIKFHFNAIDSQKIKYNAGHIREIGVKSSLSEGSTVSYRVSEAPAQYHIMPSVANVTMAVTSSNSEHLTMETDSINDDKQDIHKDKNKGSIKTSKIMKKIRILGLMAVLSYMIVILFSWIYTNLYGYVYFSAGEPNLFIKYTEWILGFTGIFVAIDSLRKEINEVA